MSFAPSGRRAPAARLRQFAIARGALAVRHQPVAVLFRPGNAGSNTATDHITTAQLVLAPLPKCCRRGRQTLIHTDSAGGTHDLVS